VGVGWASPEEVDKINVVAATRLAMERALQQIDGNADALLLDHLSLPAVELPQRALPKADAHCLSVAAASIAAKVERDRLMVTLDREFPGYGFAQHKGYGTPQHRKALRRLGPSSIHRMSWAPLKALEKAAL
jgi:ribonuclease HII